MADDDTQISTDQRGADPSSDDLTVHDDEARHRFLVTVEGFEAELVYRREPGRLTLVHTGVPDELGGRGIGSLLVRAAIERAAADGLVIAPWCPFARKWLEDHPEAAARVTLDLTPPPSSSAE